MGVLMNAFERVLRELWRERTVIWLLWVRRWVAVGTALGRL